MIAIPITLMLLNLVGAIILLKKKEYGFALFSSFIAGTCLMSIIELI